MKTRGFNSYFEALTSKIICPYFLNRMTSDVFDVLFYALGGIALYFSQNIKKAPIKANQNKISLKY